MLDATELAQIQADAAAILDKTCVIQRKTTLTADGYGSQTPTYTTINTVKASMRQPSAGELTNYAYLIADKAAWTVHVPMGTDVRYQDHFLIEGHTLEVHIALDPHTYPVLLPVITAEVR